MRKHHSHNAGNHQDSDSQQRGVLAKTVMKLLDLWMLGSEDQAALLGIASGNRAVLDRYRQGEPIGASSEQFERVLFLLEIHKNLRILLGNDQTLAGRWITSRNRAFNNTTPVEVIKEQGLNGLLMVRDYLERAGSGLPEGFARTALI